MQESAERITIALANEEAKAEQLANRGRIALLSTMGVLALLNLRSVSYEANVMNFAVLFLGFAYGIVVLIRMRKYGYHPRMKYITSCLDISMVFLLLYSYTKIEIPSVALKNYVFVILYPIIGLTAFRYDKKLTWTAGGLALILYGLLISYLSLSGSIKLTSGGYDKELFSQDVTFIGQSTKIIILVGYIALIGYLADYSRRLIVKLVSDESKIRLEQEQIRQELQVASHVQQQFVPKTFPDISGLDLYGIVEQGKFIGGDYCDFIKLADNKLLIIIGDVSGNGIPAALIMAEVRASIHLLAHMDMQLEQLVERLNVLLYQSTQKKNFVTFFVAEIDTSKQTISYLNAGHPLPLMNEEGKVHPLKKGTMPLGLFPILPNLVKHVQDFRPGNWIVAFTDGLFEQFNSEDEQFGQERLKDYFQSNIHLEAHPFVQSLLGEVKDFSREKSFDDDVGILVVKYLSAPNR